MNKDDIPLSEIKALKSRLEGLIKSMGGERKRHPRRFCGACQRTGLSVINGKPCVFCYDDSKEKQTDE